jgi:hypothetical protein
MKKTNYEIPHYAVFCSIQLLSDFYVQILFSVSCFQISLVSILKLNDSNNLFWAMYTEIQVYLQMIRYVFVRTLHFLGLY